MKLPFKLIQNTKMEKWRGETFWEKEPETIEFIKDLCKLKRKKNIRERPLYFYDVGANIGIYSLYAAFLHPDMKIFSFEPDIINYTSLLTNVIINDFKNITALPIALSDTNGLSYFNYPTGKDFSTAGRSDGRLLTTPLFDDKCFFQSYALKLDTLSHTLKYCDFLKIDVDGAEFEIIHGMSLCLPYISAILIEMDTSVGRDQAAIRFIENSGFTLDNKYNNLPNHSKFRREIEGTNHIVNYIFTKE